MDLSQDEVLSQLRDINEYEFEELVADVWEQNGWETTVTTGSNDGGVDVIAEKSSLYPQKHLLQAKRYAAGNKIGGPDIQQYYSLKNKTNVDVVAVVTTSSFSSQAEQRAKELNLKLVNSEELYQIISELDNPRDLLSKYIEMGSKSTESESPTEPAGYEPTEPTKSSELPTKIEHRSSLDEFSDLGSELPDNTSFEDVCSNLVEASKYHFTQTNPNAQILFTSESIYYVKEQKKDARYRKIDYTKVRDVTIDPTNRHRNKLILKINPKDFQFEKIIIKSTKSLDQEKRHIMEKTTKWTI